VTLPRETYTHGHHESVLRSHTWRTPQNSAAYLLDHLRPDLNLLDVGRGPGTITVDLAARVAPGRVVGLDAARPIVEQARRLSDSVEWRVGNAYALDADLHDFHVVHAHQVLQHLADPVTALCAWDHACREGGIVAALRRMGRSSLQRGVGSKVTKNAAVLTVREFSTQCWATIRWTNFAASAIASDIALAESPNGGRRTRNIETSPMAGSLRIRNSWQRRASKRKQAKAESGESLPPCQIRSRAALRHYLNHFNHFATRTRQV